MAHMALRFDWIRRKRVTTNFLCGVLLVSGLGMPIGQAAADVVTVERGVIDYDSSRFDAASGAIRFFRHSDCYKSDGLLHQSFFYGDTIGMPIFVNATVIDGFVHARFEGGLANLSYVLHYDENMFEMVGEVGSSTGWMVGTVVLKQVNYVSVILPEGTKVSVVAEMELLGGAQFGVNMFDTDFACRFLGYVDLSRPSPLAFDEDCDGNFMTNAADIAIGTSVDCQGNWIPDSCEIADGIVDCNANGIPDECEEDCNNNGLPDDCDTTINPSEDCNDNERPDECDLNTLTEVLFRDEFEFTSLDLNKWTLINGPTIADSHVITPPYAANLNLIDIIETRTLDLSGTYLAKITYAWKYASDWFPLRGPPRLLHVEYWDGTLWRHLQTHYWKYVSSPWTYVALVLPDPARHSKFNLRFRSETDWPTNEWFIDDVIIESTPADADGNGVPDTCE